MRGSVPVERQAARRPCVASGTWRGGPAGATVHIYTATPCGGRKTAGRGDLPGDGFGDVNSGQPTGVHISKTDG